MISSPESRSDDAALLQVRDLHVHFPVKRGVLRRTVGYVRAVQGVSLDVGARQTVGLVGESGCGKSTVGRAILRLIPATSGRVRFDGRDVLGAGGAQMKALRRQMQIVFQDPVGSLNPRMTVGRIVGEAVQVHGLAKGSQLQDRVAGLLRRVGLSPDYARRYPHEFSGGQRQRIGIARALALEPRFVVCDEPVSALDVSIQSQVLNLLSDLQDELGLSYLFIAHNLAVVEHFCDRVAVMYLGKIVETADREAIYRSARHPYTRALLSAAPHPEPMRANQRIVLQGEVPSPVNPPSGCAFHTRCPLTRQLACESSGGGHSGCWDSGGGVSGGSGGGSVSDTTQVTVQGGPVRVMRRCVEQSPPLEAVTGCDGHAAACWFADAGA